MKETLLPLLCCPACHGSLELQAWSGRDREIDAGLLRCGCGEAYPIIGGVPRLLLSSLRQGLTQVYGEYFAAHRHRLPQRWIAAEPAQRRVELRTQQSFGYEWTRFHALRPEWEKNFFGYLTPLASDFLAGKTVLDAGCGMGRHLVYAAKHAAMAVGVDFSRAVDAAHANTRSLPNAHVVQADLLQLPFVPGRFDFAYCLGVLHHVPDPQTAIQRLAAQLTPGGEMRIYLYWSLDDAPRWKRRLLGGVTAVRRVTTALPHPVLAAICYPITAAAWMGVVAPYRLLSRWRLTRGAVRNFPLTQYADYTFTTLLNDQFDRFSAPLERRYTAEQAATLLESGGLQEVTVRPHWGWLAHGRRPAAAAPTSSDDSGYARCSR